jgi:hypothetical protein
VTSLRPAAAVRGATTLLCLIVAAAGAGCGWFDDRRAPVQGASFTASGQLANAGVSPAHSSLGAAASDFFAAKSTPQQPIEFPHNIHVEKGVACTEYCHESVTKGPRAGLPSVNTCLICHAAIATDRPRIQQITQMSDKGIDLNWQRVYGYAPTAHVRFNHAPHIRANVECATCHGDIAHQTVAQRNVDLHMGYCVNCHRQKNAPNDCLTCHY